MTSIPVVEPPTLRSLTTFTANSNNHRSYRCYNCNHSFHIVPVTATATSSPSPSSFRCPQCHHLHLIPHHTVSQPPQPPPSTSNAAELFTHYTSDDFDNDDDEDSDYEYEEDDSNSSGGGGGDGGGDLSFSIPNYTPSLPALQSFVDSLPIKTFPPNLPSSPVPSCSICMEDFGANSEAVNELPCLHCFHKDCIVEWLNRSNTCPLCRYNLPVDPEPDDQLDEFDAVFVVDVAPRWEGVLRRSNAAISLPSLALEAEAEASGSNWRFMTTHSVVMRRASSSSNADVSLTSLAATGASSSSDRRGVTSANREAGDGWGFDAMRDEDGDTLMVDA